jgi:hypothetical protein
MLTSSSDQALAVWTRLGTFQTPGRNSLIRIGLEDRNNLQVQNETQTKNPLPHFASALSSFQKQTACHSWVSRFIYILSEIKRVSTHLQDKKRRRLNPNQLEFEVQSDTEDPTAMLVGYFVTCALARFCCSGITSFRCQHKQVYKSRKNQRAETMCHFYFSSIGTCYILL